MWLRKKIQNFPTSCTSCRLNPRARLGRLCVYGIYKRTLRAPTKESTLILIAVDIGGKNTLEQDRTRIWASPIAGPEISTVLQGILGRWDGLWLPAVTALIQEKHLLFLCFDLFYRVFWNFFLSFSPHHQFILLFAFPTVLFPLQLIFNVYKSSFSNSI